MTIQLWGFWPGSEHQELESGPDTGAGRSSQEAPVSLVPPSTQAPDNTRAEGSLVPSRPGPPAWRIRARDGHRATPLGSDRALPGPGRGGAGTAGQPCVWPGVRRPGRPQGSRPGLPASRRVGPGERSQELRPPWLTCPHRCPQVQVHQWRFLGPVHQPAEQPPGEPPPRPPAPRSPACTGGGGREAPRALAGPVPPHLLPGPRGCFCCG